MLQHSGRIHPNIGTPPGLRRRESPKFGSFQNRAASSDRRERISPSGNSSPQPAKPSPIDKWVGRIFGALIGGLFLCLVVAMGGSLYGRFKEGQIIDEGRALVQRWLNEGFKESRMTTENGEKIVFEKALPEAEGGGYVLRIPTTYRRSGGMPFGKNRYVTEHVVPGPFEDKIVR